MGRNWKTRGRWPRDNHARPMLHDSDYAIHFGKHSGRTIDRIVLDDPQYIIWALRKVPTFGINPRGPTYENLPKEVRIANRTKLIHMGYGGYNDPDIG